MNLGRLARITTRFLEVSISSSKKRRKEAIKRNKERKENEALLKETNMMTMSIDNASFPSITNRGTFKNATRREDL